MKKELIEEYKEKALKMYKKANIVLTRDEEKMVEVADFGLNDIENIGLEIVTYVNTNRCCAKELVLMPYQTCPEHVHPPIEGELGKEETFRVRYGTVYLVVDGKSVERLKARIPQTGYQYFTVFNEIELTAGMQYTLAPNTKHWFQAGAEGAVVSEFSTRSRDELDIFTDINIKRIPTVE